MEEGFPRPCNAMRLAKEAEGGEEEATTTVTVNNNGRPNHKPCIGVGVAMWSEHKAGTNKGL